MEKTIDVIRSDIEKDRELKTLWRMANVMTMTRLAYNDHGPVHARIVAKHALKLYELTLPYAEHYRWNWCKQSGLTEEDGKVIVYISSLLHDIGNAVHRSNHEAWSAILAEDIIDRVLSPHYSPSKKTRIKTEVMHCIVAHESLKAITLEASCVKIGDALDMTKGRSRIPIIRGRFSIHSESADSIEEVSIAKSRCKDKVVDITVKMTNPAGVFQIDELLLKRIRDSLLHGHVRIIVKIDDKKTKILST